LPFRYTLRQLEYLVEVGKTGSIAAASDMLNVSSPTISAAISQLEDEFGLPLFTREHAKGLTLTKAGARLAEQTQIVLSEAEYLAVLAGEISGKIQGTLTVGCLVTFAQIVLPGLRREFEQLYPTARIEQKELNQAEIFSHLRRAELDIALTYDLDIPSDLKFYPLRELQPYVVLYEGHPLAGRQEIQVEELREHPMVLLDLPYSSEYFMSFFNDAGFRPNVSERTRDMSVMRSLVANGYGFSIANVLPPNNLSPDGKMLEFVRLSGPVRSMQIGLLSIKSGNPTNTLKAFIDHCKKMVEENRLSIANLPGG